MTTTIRSIKGVALAFMLITLSTLAFAELDPDLAVTKTKNPKTMFLGGQVGFGQSYMTTPSSPGIAYKASFEPGFILPRDSWNRLEISGELGFGRASYTLSNGGKDQVDAKMNFLALIKVGYGWSLGYDSFLVTRVGIGPTLASLSGETTGGITYNSSTQTGIAAMIGADLVAAMNDHIDLFGGLSVTRVNFHVSNVTASSGASLSYNESIQINMPMLQAGLRFNL